MGLEVISGCSSVASSPCAWAWQARPLRGPYGRPLSPTRFSTSPSRHAETWDSPHALLIVPCRGGPAHRPAPRPGALAPLPYGPPLPAWRTHPIRRTACSEPACSRPPRPRHGRHPPATPTTSSNAPGFPIPPSTTPPAVPYTVATAGATAACTFQAGGTVFGSAAPGGSSRRPGPTGGTRHGRHGPGRGSGRGGLGHSGGVDVNIAGSRVRFLGICARFRMIGLVSSADDETTSSPLRTPKP